MEKLCVLLGNKEPKPGAVGIEIETEGENIRPIDSKFWRSEDDGSLRGMYPESRAEFVLKKPIEFADAEKAMDELIAHQAKSKFNFSFRTSVHIHLNAQGMTFPQLLNMVYTYLLLEQLLLNFCGESRKANRFCLRLQDAEGILDIINDLFENGVGRLVRIPADAVRYASINLEAFRKYGSVEFRGMRGTMDKGVILQWIDILKSIQDYSIKKASPKSVHDEFRELGAEKFLTKVVGKENAKTLSTDNFVGQINESYSLSLDLPYAYKEVVEKKKKELKYEFLPNGDFAVVNPAPPGVFFNPAPVDWDAMIRARREMDAMIDRPAIRGQRADVIIQDEIVEDEPE